MWRLKMTKRWQDAERAYVDTKEFAAVMYNLERYKSLLAVSPAKAIEQDYLSHEEYGIIAITEAGVNEGCEPTRMYTYADDSTRQLYLLALGKATQRNSDMEYSKRIVSSIISSKNDKNN
jgi:hypothetical protein